ncbi:MAG: hypothetical protein ACJ76I_10070 [Gaiellaceae bacterium]
MSCDFTLEHYRELLQAAKTGGYRWTGFDREPAAGDLLLRHDVDISLDAALVLAELEAAEGAWSTWFLMTRSVFYNLASSEGERAIERLRALGHRVGHHGVYPHVDLDDRFDAVVAWHNPDPAFMHEPVPGAVNVMQPPWFEPDHYRSDSNQRWRSGCPRDELARGQFEWLQLLTHPEIWAFAGGTMRESMESFLDADRTARLEHLRNDRIDLS